MTKRSLSRGSDRSISSFSLRSATDGDEGATYLFGPKDTRKSFENLSISPLLCDALAKTGKIDATVIQASAASTIMVGDDCVIASETGSGKTMAYMVPLIHQLLLTKRETEMSSDPEVASAFGRDEESVHFPKAVVMVPNKDLCRQVYVAAHELLEAIPGTPITVEAMTSVTNQWPYFGRAAAPDLVVLTPAVLGQFIRGPHIVEPALFRSIKHLVLDEADMLLDGGYKRDMEKVLDAFKKGMDFEL